MAESIDGLGLALQRLAAEIDVPPTPPIAPAVIARLRADRTLRARPPFAGLARWPRRRVLVLATAALAALLALAAAARLSIGAVEIRIQPTVSATGSPPPPENPVEFGREVSLAEARASVGFPVALPSGHAPDHAFLFTTYLGRTGALLAWEPTASYAQVPGLPWGLLLMEVTGNDDFALKTIGDVSSLRNVRVDGARGWWITTPHQLTLETDVGSRTYSVSGNVLIWQVGNVTYRLETTLGLGNALGLATSIGP
jgi:hypothetical protein